MFTQHWARAGNRALGRINGITQRQHGADRWSCLRGATAPLDQLEEAGKVRVAISRQRIIIIRVHSFHSKMTLSTDNPINQMDLRCGKWHSCLILGSHSSQLRVRYDC